MRDVCDVAYVLMVRGWEPPKPYDSVDEWLDSPLPEELERDRTIRRELGVI